MHLAQFPQIVGLTKERIRAITWEMLKNDQHFGTVSMTKYNILLIAFHWTAVVWELRLKIKKLRYM